MSVLCFYRHLKEPFKNTEERYAWYYRGAWAGMAEQWEQLELLTVSVRFTCIFRVKPPTINRAPVI